jgi:hypothetical protein
MSTLLISGFFGLTNGRRETINKPGSMGNTIRLNFICYDASVLCTSGSAAPASICVYSGSAEVPLRENTVAYIISKAFISQDGTIFMEAICLTPFPGDPDAEGYDETIPDAPIPYVFGVGQVTKSIPSSVQGSSKCFEVALSEYVRDTVNSSTVVWVDQSRFFAPNKE